jgi:uncharacterized protein YdeI (YjbR/CyaY-like superfamily)
MRKVKTPTGPLHRVTSDIQAVLKSNKDVAAVWDSLTPLAKNEWICWVTIVKKKETRAEHLVRLCEDIRRGKRRPCCWPGCPHRRPNAEKWFSKKK